MRLEAATEQNFCEDDYLIANPDVRAAVEKGVLASGRQHFQQHGYREKRRQRAPLIVFLHVPKTAGSTVNSHLMELLPGGSVHCHGWFFDDANMCRLDALPWISGHLTYATASARIRQFTSRRVEYFSCVRNPTDQVRSHYNWLIEIFHQGSGYDDHPAWVKKLSEQIRKSGYTIPSVQAVLLEYRWHFLDCQTYYLARDKDNLEEVTRAFKFIAAPGRLPELLFAMTGETVSLARRENESSHHFDAKLFETPEMQSFLHQHNAHDEELFELAHSFKLCNSTKARISPWKAPMRSLAARAKRRLRY